jgi:hypothetical protein
VPDEASGHGFDRWQHGEMCGKKKNTGWILGGKDDAQGREKEQ